MDHSLSWVEISAQNLRHNMGVFRRLVGPDRVICPAVKSNAYGHGLKECAAVMLESCPSGEKGANWLGVNSLFEAFELRDAGINAPIYIMGYIALSELEIAVKSGFHFVVYNRETLAKLDEICKKENLPAFTHIKVETGNNRQGVLKKDLPDFLDYYKKNSMIKAEGVSTHFANIEDTVDHSYAEYQLANFKQMVEAIKSHGLNPTYFHCANTAATILFPDTYFNMVRTGIGNYGLWPSSETLISAKQAGINIELKPVMTWKTRIAQVKNIAAGEFIGYGCSYKTSTPTRLAILPVGYYDGYDRNLSNRSYVLIHGKRAPIRGRVCMNIAMADVTYIPEAALEDEVVLIGKQGDENISVEQIAGWIGKINYEITTGINGKIKRVVV
jgi:alanine racemase